MGRRKGNHPTYRQRNYILKYVYIMSLVATQLFLFFFLTLLLPQLPLITYMTKLLHSNLASTTRFLEDNRCAQH